LTQLRDILHGEAASCGAAWSAWIRLAAALVGALDRRTLDRFTATLLQRPSARGGVLSKHSVHTYVRPVRLMLNWASREGEDVKARPQLPRREKPLRDVLLRDEIDALERVMPSERDKLIIRIFGDCGLRLEELCRLPRPTSSAPVGRPSPGARQAQPRSRRFPSHRRYCAAWIATSRGLIPLRSISVIHEWRSSWG
jgi:hypothetical protein